ncbi:hypothetical protein [Streptomyces sp. NPDC005407]|uniref:hypothetical protein n=1 Tax=Streptomyces sp. NPDC005407 TaxID=3155340 RepID=UPI0033BCAD65
MTATPAQQPHNLPTLGEWQPLPTAGDTPHTPATAPNPMYDRLIYGKTPADWAIRVVLVAVMTAALAVGTWSIFTLLTEVFHVPKPIAILGCGMFDGAALFFALLSQRYATTTDSGLAPRTAMLAMVGASSWVNWQHAHLEHWGTVGGVILASAPAIAELAFLMFHRFAHRETLRTLGRVPQALPTLGKWAWLAHPRRSRRAVDAHIKAALTEHEAVAERREELATERARHIVSVDRPSALTDQDAHVHRAALTLPDAHPTLTTEAERPAPMSALNTPTLTGRSPEAAAAERPAAPECERAQAVPTKAGRARTGAQSAPSLSDRKALKEQQDALTLALYTTLNDRPEWTEIRDALVSAGLESVSRPTAQRIRERVEIAHPKLPRERRRALAGAN